MELPPPARAQSAERAKTKSASTSVSKRGAIMLLGGSGT
eukprot:SAG31_NODE_31675_length_365_cov_0.973684_1_plen_38_part_01